MVELATLRIVSLTLAVSRASSRSEGRAEAVGVGSSAWLGAVWGQRPASSPACRPLARCALRTPHGADRPPPPAGACGISTPSDTATAHLAAATAPGCVERGGGCLAGPCRQLAPRPTPLPETAAVLRRRTTRHWPWPNTPGNVVRGPVGAACWTCTAPRGDDAPPCGGVPRLPGPAAPGTTPLPSRPPTSLRTWGRPAGGASACACPVGRAAWHTPALAFGIASRGG